MLSKEESEEFVGDFNSGTVTAERTKSGTSRCSDERYWQGGGGADHRGPAGESVYAVRQTDPPRGRYTGKTDVSGEIHRTGSA